MIKQYGSEMAVSIAVLRKHAKDCGRPLTETELNSWAECLKRYKEHARMGEAEFETLLYKLGWTGPKQRKAMGHTAGR